MYEVRVNRVKFRGNHGVFSQEKIEGNDFEAWIVASVDGTADTSDRVEDTIDYSSLVRLLIEISDVNKFDTIERLTGAFCEAAQGRFSTLKEITVTINKLSPCGMPEVESCGVMLVGRRTL